MSPQQAVDNWNDNNRVGTPVTYCRESGSTFDTGTRSKAFLLTVDERETAAIWLFGWGPCVNLDRVLMR